jgi:hypothetical protein
VPENGRARGAARRRRDADHGGESGLPRSGLQIIAAHGGIWLLASLLAQAS